MKPLKDKIVLVTGASAGIGAEIAKQCVSHGAKVALVARRKENLDRLAQVLGREHTSALVADVRDKGSLEAAVQETLNRFGRLDICFANAGFGVTGKFERLTIEDYQRQFDTNILGVLNTLYACLPALKESRGRVGILGSVAGYCTLPGATPYSMSKYAVRALAEGLYFEWKAHGISVTHIAPGFVSSELRHLDNHGVQVKDSPEPAPRMLVMPTEQAARQIIRAVVRRKQEQVITRHGKVLVFIRTHFWPILRSLIVFSKLGARPETKKAA